MKLLKTGIEDKWEFSVQVRHHRQKAKKKKKNKIKKKIKKVKKCVCVGGGGERKISPWFPSFSFLLSQDRVTSREKIPHEVCPQKDSNQSRRVWSGTYFSCKDACKSINCL